MCGGLFLDGTRWVACRASFFFPVRVLGRLFRRLFLHELQNAFNAGKLRFLNNLANLAEPQVFARRIGELRRLEWVVYAKPPFGGPQQGARLSRTLHPSRRHRQQPADLALRRQCPIHLEGLPSTREDQSNDAHSR